MSGTHNKYRHLVGEHGFTYMEVVVAFMIFGLMFVFVTKLGSSIYDLNRTSQIENRMYLLAELTYENYKTGINNASDFATDTGFTIDDEEVDEDGAFLSRDLSIEKMEDVFSLTIEEEALSNNISQVEIKVVSVYDFIGEVTLSGQMIRDSQ